MPIRENPRSLKLLVNQLDQFSRRALESAAFLAKSRTHYFLDLEHWLVRIFQAPGPELERVFKENKDIAESIASELSQALSSFQKGNPSIPQLSTGVIDLLVASCVVEKSQVVRPCHLLLALITDAQLSFRIKETAPSLSKLSVVPLRALDKGNHKDQLNPESVKDLFNGYRTEQ
jgi:type VI secretion system protein VasG